MLRFHADKFIAVLNLLSAVEELLIETDKQPTFLTAENAAYVGSKLSDMIEQLSALQLNVSKKKAEQLHFALTGSNPPKPYFLKRYCEELRERIQDELEGKPIYYIPSHVDLLEEAVDSFGIDVAIVFHRAQYDIEESAKCLALRRSTACVFHLMRVLEVGITGVRKALGLPDPIKDAERNWGVILRNLRDEVDKRRKLPNKTPEQISQNQFFSEVIASLDAVRHAWRNATMHVERKYTEEEAEHIFNVVKGFMKNLASRIDEDGNIYDLLPE